MLNLCRLQWLQGHETKFISKPANVRHQWMKEYFKHVSDLSIGVEVSEDENKAVKLYIKVNVVD